MQIKSLLFRHNLQNAIAEGERMSKHKVEERYWRYSPEALTFSSKTALSSAGFLLKLQLDGAAVGQEEKCTIWELPGTMRLTVGMWRDGVWDPDYEQGERWSAMAGVPIVVLC